MSDRIALLVAGTLIVMLMVGSAVNAQEPSYPLSSSVKMTYSQISSQSSIKKAMEFIKADQSNTVEEQIQLSAIPSPPFKEGKRGEEYLKRLVSAGVKDVQMDKEGNVCGLLSGAGKGPKLLLTAHLDTVFPEGTDTTVRERQGKLYGPGISDDARGLASVLGVARAFKASGIKTVGDIMVCGNVGEEGLGNLRGVKALFRDHKDIDGFISIDGADVNDITYLATGSHRYEITYKGPGGHSFSAFGLPSATHALGRAIAGIADLKVPKEPKTTFTVGTVSGGTSVNAIAAEATMLMDMRSDSVAELLLLEKQFLEIVKNAASEENTRWGSDKITVKIKLVGDRPAGSQPVDALIVQAAWASLETIGGKPRLKGASSTDSNQPISLGIPALTLGGGGKEGENHALSEWYDPTDAYLGPQNVFLTIIGLVGMNGVSTPLLSRK
ncbi:MAG TPA: M20/M25/M40 family metallo-hydrolase [Nitrospirota bacterium]|nr:M20/M25/M40 family metallo-hydrolase [Nitrospirota bacterium]